MHRAFFLQEIKKSESLTSQPLLWVGIEQKQPLQGWHFDQAAARRQQAILNDNSCLFSASYVSHPLVTTKQYTSIVAGLQSTTWFLFFSFFLWEALKKGGVKSSLFSSKWIPNLTITDEHINLNLHPDVIRWLQWNLLLLSACRTRQLLSDRQRTAA